MCDKFGLERSRVCTYAQVEVANMMTAGRILEDENSWASIACDAHLQTCVRHAIEAVKPMQAFLSTGHLLVSHFHQSALANEQLTKQQERLEYQEKPVKLIQDCPTWWNSSLYIQDCPTRWKNSLYILQRLLHLKVAVTAVLDRD